MKTILIIVIVILAGWGVYAMVNRDAAPMESTQTPASNNNQSGASDSEEETETHAEEKTFTVVGKSFSFSPSTIRVNKGDRVRIVFQNQGGTHDWVIDEFNARTQVLQSGATETIEFVADKSGSFEYYCSVGTHRQMGMKGVLVVQ